MKEDWTDRLKKKLATHEAPPPSGLWEGISEQMGLPLNIVRKPAFFGWHRWVAAAVVLLLVGLTGFYVLYQQQTQPEVIPMPSPYTHFVRTKILAKTNDEKEKAELVGAEKKHSLPCMTKVEPVHLAEKTEHEAVPVVTDRTAEKSADEATTTDTAAMKPKRERSLSVQNVEKLVATTALPHREEDRKKNFSSQFSIGMEGSGGLLAAQTLHRENRIYYTKPSGFYSGSATDGNMQVIYSLTDYTTKHHLPVRFGLTVQWYITQRLALTTGLHYTHLHSEFRVPLHNYTLHDQHLHYLGLPLGLACHIWGNRHFHFYASAGTLMEKCLNERPWQWSVNGSVGAEYLFHHRVGLYAEPSAGYYFKDGTSFQHYYKEYPFAPSIEVGLRLHINN